MITPYLTFYGDCAAAMAFYEMAFQTAIRMQQPYGDYVPEGLAVVPPNLSAWVMHGEMEIGGTVCWFADEAAGVTMGNQIKLTVAVPTKEEAEGIFLRLKEGTKEITLPPTQTFYSAFHGGLVDRYGMGWNIVCEQGPDT
ncbi:glyoxalase/bleomycin resistance/extradiol dioxygenase family protein [Eubacteriales bacterium OttesenSCG-928-M02]|nr:glyoxalase/bleomycin resistance/extradiol dioxygenase family protein [Eubacteriales bacterium OttesenSCG-928-M02]